VFHVREITGSIFDPRPSIVSVFVDFLSIFKKIIPLLLNKRYHYLLRCTLTKMLIAAFSVFEMEDLSLS
jgi:hypothetical protein